MNYEQMNNNKVYLQGIIVKEGEFSHEYYGEKFYEFLLSVPRLSQSYDIIPITISERIITQDLVVGKEIAIKGQLRSYNKLVETKSKLVLSVFVRDILQPDNSQNPNSIIMTGYVCKQPVYRTTPFKREICDVLVAVNRAYNKSDYLPCIAWGRNARFVKNFKVGDKIEIVGRVQSRDYQKRIDENTVENRTAYEISITQISATKESNIPTLITDNDDTTNIGIGVN